MTLDVILCLFIPVQCLVGAHVRLSPFADNNCGRNSFGSYKESCSFYCDPGYVRVSESIFGSCGIFTSCRADGSWSTVPTCVIVNCSTSPPLVNSQLQLPCDTQYQSTCTATCDEGYTRDNITSVDYYCNVSITTDRVEWMALDGASCQAGV